MVEITKHETGMFSWADLTTPDLEGSQKFYTTLLSLDHEDAPVGEGMVYSMLKKNGRGAFAMNNMTEEMKAMTGGRATWRVYFTVENTDEIARRASELGATVIAGPMDVFTAGRMAVIHDPAGAEFGVWQPMDHIGAGVFGEPGALCWTELSTNDTAAAAQFYSALFGWSVNVNKSPTGADYTMFSIEDRPVGGMLAIQPEWGEVPPNWSVYIGTGDLDAALEDAKGMGASSFMPVMEVPNIGRFTMLQDPQGSHFTLMEFAGAPPAH